MQIERATTEDAVEILGLQKAAYRQVAERYDDLAIPPLTETLEDTESQFAKQTFLKVCLGDDLVGSVRAYQENNTCYIGRLIVAPAFQGQGIGTAMLLSIESAFPEAEYFELFTGHKCLDNIRLYERLGYQEVGREIVSAQLTHILMRKENNRVDGW